jgi:GNAT superfamily N-acetyltransferase
MEFRKIKDTNSKDFKKVWNIYESSFPDDEKRDLESQKEVIKHPSNNFYAIIEEGETIGLFEEWDFGDFIFGEHVAIREDLRNKGFGTKLFKEYLKRCGERIFVGEVEGPKEGGMAKRRIGFYSRLGILLNDHRYVQPAYSPDKNPMYLFLITYPRKITKEEFVLIRDKIHRVVYGQKEPIIEI